MAEPAVTLATTTPAALARARSPVGGERLSRRAHSYSVRSVSRPQARRRRPLQQAIERGLANLNRRVYPLAPGRWLRRRLQRQLRFQAVPFADAAAIFEMRTDDGGTREFGDPDVRFSAGLGLQRNLLGIPGGAGQVRLDITRRLDRRRDDWTYRFLLTQDR